MKVVTYIPRKFTKKKTKGTGTGKATWATDSWATDSNFYQQKVRVLPAAMTAVLIEFLLS